MYDPAFDPGAKTDKARSKAKRWHKDKTLPWALRELAEFEWNHCVGKGGGEGSNCRCKSPLRLYRAKIRVRSSSVVPRASTDCSSGTIMPMSPTCRIHSADEDNREKHRQMFKIGDRYSCRQHDEGRDQEEGDRIAQRESRPPA
jgi:hypothetical protein